ncbi:MAG TPA: carbohydrate ABC transporter permease [Streptosporangiaceae bacterium]|jgi:multiple sugar transport system permease protein|nr:carbohydrate ABC transporter permease [Streptosporangiaceae bacterium]
MAITSPRRRPAAVAAYLVLSVIGVFFLAPLLWVILASLNAHATLAVNAPSPPTLANFRQVLTGAQTLRPLLNGLILSGGAAIAAMAAATLAAYPLSRYQLRFKRPFMYVILFATGLPITAVMVPVYGLFVEFNLLDSMGATIAFLATTTLPFAIWLMKNFMDGVPIGLEEAAWVDGASSLSALRRIVLPLILPGVSVVGIFTFIMTWGNFFVPFILLTDPNKQPASVSIYQFFSQYGNVSYGPLAAFSIIFTIPVVALYVLIQRTLGGAFNLAGATKG